MQKMLSSVGSNGMAGITQLNLLLKKSAQSQDFVKQAASMLAISGTPGDVDIRGFLSPAFQPFQTIQQGQNNQVVGNIAYKTNQSPYTGTTKVRRQGLFAKSGYETQAPIDYNLPVPLPPIIGLDDPKVYALLADVIKKDTDYVTPIITKVKDSYAKPSQVNAVQPSNMGSGLVRLVLNYQ